MRECVVVAGGASGVAACQIRINNFYYDDDADDDDVSRGARVCGGCWRCMWSWCVTINQKVRWHEVVFI
jgi:hypothetical protein